MDLTSRLRSIVRESRRPPGTGAPQAEEPPASGVPGTAGGPRELTYEPELVVREATINLDRVGEILGGRCLGTPFGGCLAIDRRYESDRWHGTLPMAELYEELQGGPDLSVVLSPSAPGAAPAEAGQQAARAVAAR